jgi:hypothetical protein
MENKPEIFEIFEYYYEPFYQTMYFKILMIVVIISLISLVIFVILRRRKKIISPAQWAAQELAKLNIDSYNSKDDIKRFYYAITMIMKEYLFRRFGWLTLNKTDDELIPYLEKQHFNAELLEALKTMLQGSQVVKFANQDVIKTQARKDYNLAQDLIEKTKPTDNEKDTP